MQGELHPSTSRSGYSVRNNKIEFAQLMNKIDDVIPDKKSEMYLMFFPVSVAIKNFRHRAFSRGVKMLDNDKCHTADRRHIFEKLFECSQPSGGCANSHDMKGMPIFGWYTLI